MSHICGRPTAPFTDDMIPAAVGRRLLELTSCCIAAACDGPAACTCWEPEYDLEQADPVVGPQLEVMPPACGDCAYRSGSPERSGDDRYMGAGELDRIAATRTFSCHQGMRRVVRWRHPCGITIEATETDDYRPPIRQGVPYRADGQPGLLCAGWAAAARKAGNPLAPKG